MDDFSALPAFLGSLGVGLLIGLERERRPGVHAGLRTFALAGVAGAATALLGAHAGAPWLLAALLLALAGLMAVAELRRETGTPPDATTAVALLLCAVYGAMLWYGYTRLTVALALATTVLLYFKAELHDVTHRLSRRDMLAFLQFVAISCVVLPALPDQGFGPYDALNPHEIWLMVVLVAGVGLAGYVALRLVGARRAPVLLGLLGGVVSSTATTLVFARRGRAGKAQADQALTVILTANLVLLARMALMAAIVAPTVLPSLGPVLLLGLLPGAAATWIFGRRSSGPVTDGEVVLANPLELLPAIGFGAVYGVAVLLTAWLNEQAGSAGVYAAAPVLGLTDMDAITLSTYRLFSSGELPARAVCIALGLAIAANLAFKAGIATVLGGRALGARVALGYAAVLAGLVAGILAAA